MAGPPLPQGTVSSYAPRLRIYNNSLLTPILHQAAPANPLTRTTKRGTTVINYAEDGYDDLDDDDNSRRRPTGLRSLRREESASEPVDPGDRYGKEASGPIEIQGIHRDWMTKNQARSIRSDVQNQAQAKLPTTLIPVRIDVEIPAFMPQPALAITSQHHQQMLMAQGIDTAPYKVGETTVPYRLKDNFMWNLHETVITTDAFGLIMAQDLDLPNKVQVAAEISKQIRTQLEEYAGIALHPLFQTGAGGATAGAAAPTTTLGTKLSGAAGVPAHVVAARSGTPATATSSRQDTPVRTTTPGPSSQPQPAAPSSQASTTQPAAANKPEIHATATTVPDQNPDDAYRCIITLSINLSSQLYTDKFEWSLLHPPGLADQFARQTCTDVGLSGEWIPALTHGIYEAVLKLKKEACESGGLALGGMELQNDAAPTSASGSAGGQAAVGTGNAEAGWRYDPEHVGSEWGPRIEHLSKEDIEKREGDREREIRRLRRETARFTNAAGPGGGFGLAGGVVAGLLEEEERMGRGERSKKKRRFRSLSPMGRSGTPGGRGTPDVGGGGGVLATGVLTDMERANWRCAHCKIWGTCVWAVRDGPFGPKSLCHNCGYMYEQDRKLPSFMKAFHIGDMRLM